MKVSYEYYVDTFKGKICQPEFEDLVEPVIDLVKGYAEQFIAPWALEKNIRAISFYHCLELKRAVCYQIDYLQANGGLNALNGTSDLDLQSVSKDGFNYSYGDRGNKFNGVPFSSVSAYMIKSELRRKGLMCRVAKRYD